MTTLTTFHLFSLLPTEIRLHIWALSITLSLTSPSTTPITISCDRGILPNSRRYARLFRSSRPPPPQLLCTRESRHEALRHFTPLFRTTHVPDSCLYISPAHDTLRLPESLLAYLGPQERSLLRTLTLEIHDYMLFGAYWMETLRGMTALEELVLVNYPAAARPYQPGDWLVEGEEPDKAVVRVLGGAFVEGKKGDLGWRVPVVRVEGVDGRVLGGFGVVVDGEGEVVLV